MNKKRKHNKTLQHRIYNLLLCRIKRLLKHNDKSGIEQIRNDKLCSILSNRQLNMLNEKIANACLVITLRLCNGTITPMMLSDKNKCRSAYIYYLRYLRDVVYKENPVLAKQLAFEVYKDIQSNTMITLKVFFDEQYFCILLPEVINCVSEEKETNPTLNKTI